MSIRDLRQKFFAAHVCGCCNAPWPLLSSIIEHIGRLEKNTVDSVTVADTKTVAPGQPAYVVNQGTPKNVKLEFGIPEGIPGVNSVEVGETLTLAPGSDAYVRNVGDYDHLNLEFGIPKGEKGDQGEQGIQGEPGEPVMYETVLDMVADAALVEGVIAGTLGFHAKGDGGAAFYTIQAEQTPNEMDVISLANGYFAVLVVTEPYVTPEMFGAYGDGVHDDKVVLNYLFSFGNFAVVSLGGKTYLSSDAVTVQTRRSINMNLSTIKFTHSGNGFVIDVTNESDYSHNRFAPTIENIIIDGGNTAIAFYVYVGYKSHISNVYINNFKNVGMQKDTGYEMVIDNIWFWAASTATKAVGLYAYGNDCEYGALFGINCNVGVKMRGGGNHFSFIHFWLLSDHNIQDGTLLYDDCCTIEIVGNDRYHIDYIYFDTARYDIKYSGYGYVYISSALSIMADASSFVADFATKPTYLIYADVDHLPYIRRIFIENIYATGSSMIDKSINYVIPEGYESLPLHINNAVFNKNTINDNRPTNFIEQFTINNGTLITGHAVTLDEQTIHLQAIVKQTSPTEKLSISYPNWVMPIVINTVIPTTVNTNQYFTGSSSDAALNIGTNAIGLLSTLVNDGYYYINVMLKRLFVA